MRLRCLTSTHHPQQRDDGPLMEPGEGQMGNVGYDD
jgi:hypothetical protein